MSAPPGERLHRLAGRSRRPLYGIAGQLLNAGTNVATAYIASLLLAPAEFGTFVIAFACVTVVLAAGRGLVGTTMMVHLPTVDGEERAAALRSAIGLALVLGAGATVLLALAGLAQPVLWVFAPWVAVALLHDVARYAHLAVGRTDRALVLDVVWALVQGAVIAAVTALDAVTIGLVAAAWGLGAASGLVAFAVLHGARPSHPRVWARTTRDVAGWFTAVAVLGQVEIYLVLVLTGFLLAPADVGGVRTVQLLAYQPAVVLLAALLTVLQPSVVRARHSPPALRTAVRRIVVVTAPVIGALALLALLRDPLMRLLFGQYVAYSPLVVPIAVQSAFVALMIAPLCVLNGLRRGAAAFRMQLLRTVGTAVAAAVGMQLAGVQGLAWALALATALAWGQSVASARRAVSHLEAPS